MIVHQGANRERDPAGVTITAALKDAALAALIAFGLFSFILGLRTEQSATGQIILMPRPMLLAAAVAIVFAGRFVVALLFRRGLFGNPAALVPAAIRARLD
jgi:branched-chain amino acid transport system permease protein